MRTLGLRVNKAMLENMVDRLNEATNNNKSSWTRNEEGKYKANIGNYHLDYAYGQVQLCQMMSEGGGVNVIFGFTGKKQLFVSIKAYLMGIELKGA